MKRFFPLLFGLFVVASCIDRLDISVPSSNASQLVVDGVITDEPGPYRVKLSLSETIDGFLKYTKPITAKKVTLFDDAGNEEVMQEMETGTFQTKTGGIRGVVGRSYYIRIETRDDKTYESLPDKMAPVGNIDSLYYEFETIESLDSETKYGFRFFINSQGLPEGGSFVRWKFTSVFELDTEPKLRLVPCRNGAPCACPDPPTCSGWTVTRQGDVVKVGDCSCCTCWVTQHETKPHLGDYQFTANALAKKVEVGYIPLEYYPFLKGKNRAEVLQMSLSSQAYEYWKMIQIQKEGAASLFQSPAGKLTTTIFEKNGAGRALGIFYASAVQKRQRYLTKADVKVKFSRVPFWDCEFGTGRIPQSCLLAYPSSSTQRPADWQ